MPLILYFKLLKIGVICTGMSATWRYFMSEQLLLMAAGLADRRQTFEETNYWFETPRYFGVTIENQVER